MATKKIFKRLLIALLIIFLALLAVVVPQRVNPAQERSETVFFDLPDTLSPNAYDWDSIAALGGASKRLEKQFQRSAMIALSTYPDLRNVKINFVTTDGGAPMETNFELVTLFGDRSNRVYEIRLNDAENSMFEGILMRNLPFDARVGILAHELGHVLYYERLSTLQIAKWGLMYLVSLDFRATHEKSTDLIPIHRGLGAQLYQYAWFIRHHEGNQKLYAKWGSFIDLFYLTDEEVLEEWSWVESNDLGRSTGTVNRKINE